MAVDTAVLQRPHAALTRRRWRLLPFLGPAFIACVAYIDPGNFATNIAGGSTFGYRLVWVIVAANLLAMLIQTLSAKLGIATGRNLPEVCRERLSKRTSVGVTYAQIKNDAGATYTPFTGNGGLGGGAPHTALAGEDPRFWSMTIRHAF